MGLPLGTILAAWGMPGGHQRRSWVPWGPPGVPQRLPGGLLGGSWEAPGTILVQLWEHLGDNVVETSLIYALLTEKLPINQ